jgi:hypothetical protein
VWKWTSEIDGDNGKVNTILGKYHQVKSPLFKKGCNKLGGVVDKAIRAKNMNNWRRGPYASLNKLE